MSKSMSVAPSLSFLFLWLEYLFGILIIVIDLDLELSAPASHKYKRLRALHVNETSKSQFAYQTVTCEFTCAFIGSIWESKRFFGRNADTIRDCPYKCYKY
jgi:hypothetical protein